jgi:endonuclease YncB( thermonuclease family)
LMMAAMASPALAQDGIPQDWQSAPVTLPDGRGVTVVDGDSIAVDGAEWRIRGYDAAEIGKAVCEGERRLGLLAKRRLDAAVRSADAAPITIIDSGERDKYHRPLGDVLIAGASVREMMVSEGYGRPYNGGRKRGWCSRDSRDDLIPGPLPARNVARKGS